jgi:hypothetical protein
MIWASGWRDEVTSGFSLLCNRTLEPALATGFMATGIFSGYRGLTGLVGIP